MIHTVFHFLQYTKSTKVVYKSIIFTYSSRKGFVRNKRKIKEKEQKTLYYHQSLETL
jgi:hypothetical protein